MELSCFADSDHVGDLLTCRSWTDIIIYANRAPIYWYTKKQMSMETSSFGSEVMALKMATQIGKGLQYKLRMMGVPIMGSCHIMVDNMLFVVHNTSNPVSNN